MRRGLFVTGTDTGIGKTVVSAALMCRYGAICGLRYWKPVQTGIEQDDDTATVRRLSRCQRSQLVERGIRLRRPVSPHLAARHAGTTLDVATVMRMAPPVVRKGALLVEGAGGVLVPLNGSETMADLIGALDLPSVVVVRSTLGTINHTLLTLEALRKRDLTVAGVVMVGPRNDDNRDAIESYGDVTVVGELSRLRPLNATALRRWAVSSLDRSNHLEQWLR